IMENTNLSKQQQVSEIMRQMLTQAQTAGQYFTNDQIKEMTRKVSAEVDLVHQQTQNQRYGSSHIGATAKDISNVVTDAASGVVDIFHGIDKAVADTWKNLLKFMRASIKMIGVSNLQSFIASMTQKLTLSDISDESKNY